MEDQSEFTTRAGTAQDVEEPQTGTEQLKDTASEALDRGQEQLRQAGEKVKQRAHDAAAQQKDRLSGRLEKAAEALHAAADKWRGEDESMARLGDQAADRLHGFSESLQSRQPEEILRQVQDFARRNPAAFLAAAFIGGLAMGRLLRSSSSRRSA